MNVLVVGNGGREHALVWKLAQSQAVSTLFCAPGNAGTAERAENTSIRADDVAGLVAFARERAIDFTVVGPEMPLALGIVDAFRAASLPIFGPTQQAAQLEVSKAFAKALMQRHGIPTAPCRTFSDFETARLYIDRHGFPLVVKADGLAAGKGAVVCHDRESAQRAIAQMLRDKVFGEAGSQVVIEDFLRGEEISFFALTDGTSLLELPVCQDHKAAYDHDEGPNTGGMGAYSPVARVDAALAARIMKEIMQPVVHAMAAEGRPYQGVLYAGLMLVDQQPYVLEFNARFGDPEAQTLLRRLDGDLFPLLWATTNGTLDRQRCRWHDEAAVCVVMASHGYPEAYERGHPIDGLAQAEEIPEVAVFHAGTARRDGRVVTNGGRVLGVTALGADIRTAIERAYQAVQRISWEGAQYRTDIGRKALQAS